MLCPLLLAIEADDLRYTEEPALNQLLDLYANLVLDDSVSDPQCLDFYKISGLVSPTPFQATIISKGICGTLGGLLGLFATRYFGRRALLLVSYSVGSICMLIVAVVYTVQPTALSTGQTILGVFCVFNLFFFGA